MIDRSQLLNDAETSIRLAMDGRQATIWTAIPCIVESVNLTAMTLEAQPAIKGTIQLEDGTVESVDLPLLGDVPICFPSGGGFTLTFPIEAGDEVLVVFASRCIDSWWQSGGIGKPLELRMHDLSDGFAIPGPKSIPNVLPIISSSSAQLRNRLGTTYIQVSSTKIKIANISTTLNTVLQSLVTAIEGMTMNIGGFGPNQGTVSATSVAALSSIATQIGTLLE